MGQHVPPLLSSSDEDFVTQITSGEWASSGELLDAALSASFPSSRLQPGEPAGSHAADEHALMQLLLNRAFCHHKQRLYRQALQVGVQHAPAGACMHGAWR